jgi:hypothetical protein
MARAELGTRMQIAFYGSTPAYRVVLDAHGLGELQPELNALSKQGRWTEMGELISDDILETFAVRCRPEDLPARLGARYAGLVDRLSLVCHATPQTSDPERWADVVARLRKL